MYLGVPAGPARKRPLVVVLHGCGQTAEGFDRGSGWSRLADSSDFLVLYPEQQRANNANTCFSWFSPGDTQRGSGEVASISQMVDHAVAEFGADPAQVFVCGLSAGGAMAAALLATYPDVFKAGAIIAGLPYGTAATVSDAFDAMSKGRIRDAKQWGDRVRAAADHSDSRLSVAIWYGTADTVVKPINAGELVKQWTNVLDVGSQTPAEDQVGSATRRRWFDAAGEACVAEYCLEGFPHAAPVAETAPPYPFFLPAGLSSTHQIAEDFGLLGASRSSLI